MRNGTLTSFTRAFNREIKAHPHLKEASEFGREVIKFTNRIQEKEGGREVCNRLVEAALQILPMLYRAYHLDHDLNSEVSARFYGEALSSIKTCRQLLSQFNSSKNLSIRLNSLETRVLDWMEEIKIKEV